MPYYTRFFFNTIIDVRNDGWDVSMLTTCHCQWYRLLLEKNITMIDPVSQPGVHRPCRVELISPATEWAYLWWLVHGLLPCEARLASIFPRNSPVCVLVWLPTGPKGRYCALLFHMSADLLGGQLAAQTDHSLHTTNHPRTTTPGGV